VYRIAVGNLTIFNFKFIKRNLVTQQFVITGIMVFKGVSAKNAVDMDYGGIFSCNLFKNSEQ
jgi:hypothetical protein